MRYRRWLQSLAFDRPADQIALQEMLQAERNATERLDRLTGHIEALVPEWDLAPAVNALQTLVSAIMLAAIVLFWLRNSMRLEPSQEAGGHPPLHVAHQHPVPGSGDGMGPAAPNHADPQRDPMRPAGTRGQGEIAP